MKIIHIVPGSGDTFYCENCLRDGTLVKELRNQGHDVVMVPMYLPLFLDNADLAADVPVFFGGINTYLQEHVGLFRKTPRWLDRLFDSKVLLKLAAQKAGSTKADGLGSMTLSMLEGEEGRQAKELKRLLEFLENEKPELIHISNALLLGIADAIKAQLTVPIVCSLQDEDVWVDALDKPYDVKCWNAISEKSASVDAFIAVSEHYSGVMKDKIGLDDDKLHVIPAGIDFSGFKVSSLPQDPPVIGYMARMSESMGLGVLIDAFIELKNDERFSGLKLMICGGEVGDDKKFSASLKKKLRKEHLLDDVDFIVSFDRLTRIEFLSSLTIFSVPVPEDSAFGTYVVEAIGAGVPVVQPRNGAFPEIIEATGGGVLYDAGDPDAYLKALQDLLLNMQTIYRLAGETSRTVRDKFSIDKVCLSLAALYESILHKY